MSVLTKKRPTKHHKNEIRQKRFLIFIEDSKTYKIPKSVANNYIVTDIEIKDLERPAAITPKISRDSISSDEVFSNFEAHFTRSGALLKGLRVRENLTQMEFARKIGITQPNLSSMENGHRPIGKEIAKRIGTKFKVNYRYFLE